MKFSYNWLCELVEGLDATPKELGELITMKTAECEGVEPYAPWLDKVCAARLVSVEPIAGSKNKKVVIDAGPHGAKTVVCGAPNARPGIVSAYVPPGVALEGGREIRSVEIAGVLSEGMLASGAELGINRDAAGILEFEAEPGEPVPGCRPDYIIEIDNKSITHRPDLWGHHGLAREIAAILGKKLRDPVDMSLLPEGEPEIAVRIEDYDLCPRYSALAFDGIQVGPSPLWLQYRLQAIDLNPISNVVDVTNWIMAEIAEPMHAFDRDALRGETIIVRTARPGETITALNGETYELDEATLVIADEKGPVAIAGVMGGLDTGVVESTRRIVLESANFHPANIRKTSVRLKLRTDASMRFEKAQDPHNTVRGLARAVELFRKVSPGVRITGGLADAMRELPPPPRIALEMGWLARKLGRKVEQGEVKRILEALEFQVKETGPRSISVTVPSWRATRDVSIKDDLVEEIGRMVGYDTVPVQAPLIPSTVPPADPERALHRSLRALVSAQGFTEVYNYSFIGEELAREFGLDPEAHLRIVNPIAAELTLMRMSLVPGIVRNIRENAKHYEAFRLFEIGYEIHKKPNPEGKLPAPLPDEIDHLVAAIYTREGDGSAGLFEMKRLAECIMPGAEVVQAEARPYEHPFRSFEVHWRGRRLGRIFELHPKMLETGRAALLDIDLDVLLELGPREKKYKPLRRYPASAFDLSVVVDAREYAGSVQKRLAELAGDSLESIVFLRQYSGPPLPEGKKSLSFRLTVFAPDHTLTADEVSAIRQRIIDGMRAAGYELRL